MLALLTAELGFRLPKGSETQVGPHKRPQPQGKWSSWEIQVPWQPYPVSGLCQEMFLPAPEASRSYPGWREGTSWGMGDLSPALRAQALLHGTSHLQTDVGQIMAGGTHLLFKENGAARTPTGDPDLSRSTVAVLQLDSKLQSMLGQNRLLAPHPPNLP